jgi:hypothetical protein
MRQNAAALPAKASAVERIASDVFIVSAMSGSRCEHGYADYSDGQPVPVDDSRSTPGR